MAKAIEFAVRDSAGGMARGFVAGDGTSSFVQMGIGDEISLNLSRQSVASFIQKGDDLVVTLIDGREITLDGYFNTSGEPNQLYLSQGGEVVAVEFSPAGNGTLYASYGPADGWDKFSTMDNLRFAATDDLALAGGALEEPAGMAGFVPGLVGLGGLGAGLIGAGLIAGAIGGGGGGGGGDNGPRPPTVNDPTSSNDISTVIGDKTPNVSGTGEPGDTVTVTIGDKTQTTTIKEDGTWAVEFPDLPADGTYESEAEFTHPDGTKTELDGPTFVIDMTPPPVAITDGAKSTGDIENETDYSDGKVTISGSGEAGASIKVEINGHTQTTTVSNTGTWTVNFPTTQIPAGEYETAIKVTATDSFGNATVITDTLVVDTVNTIGFNSVTTDNVVNGAEATAGFVISGSSQAGATVVITLQGVTKTVTAGADGKWSFDFAAGQLTAGEYTATVSATSTDSAGNVKTATHSFTVDTTTNVSLGVVATDDVVNAAEAGAGVTLSGTGQAGSSVKVEWNGQTLTGTVGADGKWAVNFATVAGGTYATTAIVTATDAAGNTATTTRAVQVDTEISVSIDASQAGGDNIVSALERSGTLVLTGRAEAGARVEVTFEGVTRVVTANGAGVWSANYAPGEYPAGTYDATISVKATDAAGNTATATRTIDVDTEVVPFAKSTDSTGTDKVLNGTEAAAGLTVTGVVEPGSTVTVKLGTGATVNATVAADGSWTAVIPAGQIPAGEGTASLQIKATDHVGNTSVLNETVKIDTLVNNLTRTGTIAGDGVINETEAAAGVLFQGTVEANSTVVVTLTGGASRTITVGADGKWSATFAEAELPQGTGTGTVTVHATDAAGNTKSISDTFGYDTDAPTALNVVNISKSNTQTNLLEAVRVDGAAEEITLHRVNANGSTSEVDYTVEGRWLEFAAGQGVPDGSYLVIQNEDAAGNSTSTLLVVNNTTSGTVDLSRSGLEGFDVNVIDLHSAPQANLTITASDIARLTGLDQELTIKGGSDDNLSLQGATRDASADTAGYHAYSLGGGLVLVDEDITTTII